MTDKINDLKLSERLAFLNETIGPNFRAEEIIEDGSFSGWKILKVDDAPSLIARELYPYGRVSPLFGKLTIYEADETIGVPEMAQKLWNSVKERFGIEMQTTGFEPKK